MAPKPRAVTAKALQTLLVHVGAPSSGTKAVLQERFRRDIEICHLSKNKSAWQTSKTASKKLRIMSIDMGIKNLAFCEAEVSYPLKNSLDAEMKILRWEKINLIEAPNDDIHDDKTNSPKIKTIKKGKASVDEDEGSDPFSADALSKTAYGLIKNTILTGSPDIILIEKQRWRSGGGSAVQQWTLRVNTLEGMLWAVLQTLHAERLNTGSKSPNIENPYEVFSADPKRVGQYWLTRAAGRLAEGEEEVAKLREGNEAEAEAESAPTKKALSRSKAEKKVKIALLRSWLTATPASTASVTQGTIPGITFSFAPHAESTRQALLQLSVPKRRKKAKDGSDDVVSTPSVAGSALKKLDDVTDCFLQAAAWVSWESNRLQLQHVWNKSGDGTELTDEVLVDMMQEINES